MSDTYLDRIVVRFPTCDHKFYVEFTQFFNVLGENKNDIFKLDISNESYYPKLSLDFHTSQSEVLIDFILSQGEIITVNVVNFTGENRQSPHSYSHMKLDQVIERLNHSGIRLIGIDHVGFNLPWFS
jgi:hypothetical protein